MSLLPRISGREAVAAFRKLGYEVDRQKGSHIILRHRDPPFRSIFLVVYLLLFLGPVAPIFSSAFSHP